jgi:hypothetical protein
VHIHASSPHAGEIDDYPVIARSKAGDIVSTPTHRERKLMVRGEPDALDDVRDAATASDKSGVAIDHAVPHATGDIVPGIIRSNQLITEFPTEIGGSRVLRHCLFLQWKARLSLAYASAPTVNIARSTHLCPQKGPGLEEGFGRKYVGRVSPRSSSLAYAHTRQPERESAHPA